MKLALDAYQQELNKLQGAAAAATGMGLSAAGGWGVLVLGVHVGLSAVGG